MEATTATNSTKRLTRKQITEKKASLKITKEQREVLVGLILGDGHLGTRDKGRTYRLVYSQSEGKHGIYLKHVYNIFRDWTLTPPVLIKASLAKQSLASDASPGIAKRCARGENASSSDARSGIPAHHLQIKPLQVMPGRYNTKDRLKFTTVVHGSFRFYGNAFYKGGIKVVPKGVGRLLTARGLAYWYMDDGSIKSRQSKGLILNTHSFALAEVELLCRELGARFGLQAKPRPQPSASGILRYQIYISGRSYERACELMLPHLLPEMMYKFPAPRKHHLQSKVLQASLLASRSDARCQ